MASIVDARNPFGLVMRTIKWIEQVECLVSDVYNPFRDMLSMTKNEHKGYIETNLSTNRVPGKFIQGHRLFDFRENLWLHTTSILVSMMVLRDEYPDVGIINPSYRDFALPYQKRRVAGGLGACDPRYKRVIGIFNISGHWVAFLVHRTDWICYVFDPLHVDNNYRIIEKSVRGVIEDILQVKDALTYEKVDWCTQKGGSSGGVWCIAILELLLSDSRWDDCLYKIVPYLRMRFLHKAIAFVGKNTDVQL